MKIIIICIGIFLIGFIIGYFIGKSLWKDYYRKEFDFYD